MNFGDFKFIEPVKILSKHVNVAVYMKGAIGGSKDLSCQSEFSEYTM